jgi:hypothetical protein
MYHNLHKGTFPSLEEVLLESTGSGKEQQQKPKTTLFQKFMSIVKPHLNHYVLFSFQKFLVN